MPQSVQSSILWAVPKPRKLGELWHKSIRNKMLGWDVGFCCCHLWLLQVKITMTCNINLQVWHFACYIICFKIASTDFAFASCLRLIYSVSSEWCRALAHKVIPKMTYNVLSVELKPYDACTRQTFNLLHEILLSCWTGAHECVSVFTVSSCC